MAINIPLITDYDGRGVKKAEKAFANLGKSTKALGANLKAVFIPAAAAVGALAAVSFSAVKAAVEDASAQALLAKQLQNSTKATKADIAATEDFITAMSLATGVADDDLRPALASLVRVTRNTQKSQKLLRVALNVSKGTGKSLSSVVQAISRAFGGNVKALAKLDPSLKQYITKTSTADQITARLARNFTGAAATAANTYAGRLDRMNVAFAEAKESLGVLLLPILEKFVTVVTDSVIPYVDKMVRAFEQGGLAGAFKVASKDALSFTQNLTGLNAVLFDLGATAAITFTVFKGISTITTAVTAFKALTAAIASLGSVFTPIAATSFGVIAGAIALVVAGVYVLIDALRDPIFRQEFGRFLLDSVKLVANAFIFLTNQIITFFNAIIRAINIVKPGKDLPTFGKADLFQFSMDSGPISNVPRAGEAATSVQINVNGGDPQATVDAITRWYRQNGATVAWMR